jgi:hypothetical protein
MTSPGFDPFVEALRAYAGLSVTRDPGDEGEELFIGEATGSPLFGDRALTIKANPRICTFLILVGILPQANLPRASSLLAGLLELNFKHTLGRTSLARLGNEEAILCETMFFWSESIKNPSWFREKISHRLTELASLHRDALSALHSFQASAALEETAE